MTPVNEDMSIKQARDLAATFDFFISCSTNNRIVVLLHMLSELAELMNQDYQEDDDEDSREE